MKTGGYGRCSGLGSTRTVSSGLRYLPDHDTTPSLHSWVSRSSFSSKISRDSSGSCPKSTYVRRSSPRPTTRSTRPPESTSSVA